MNDIANYLAQHRFRELFIEELGWDHASGGVELRVDDRCFPLTIIAHKRGLQILHSLTDHFTLINRGRLRRLQRKLASQIHEHVIIYSCESPHKQVWQWAVRRQDGRRLRHREHPFFSDSPPKRLLNRLAGLRFDLKEEEGVTIVDAFRRVRAALDQEADLNLFVNRPWYAQRSNELARAMETGGDAELHDFILFHRPLVTWAVKPLVHLFQGELEDAEQVGMLGLMHAARNYQPSRGSQFSTYATVCIKGFCKRYMPAYLFSVRVPMHVIWPCFKLRKAIWQVAAGGGPQAVRQYLDDLAIYDPGLADEWEQFRIVANIRSLSHRSAPEYREALAIPAGKDTTVEEVAHRERAIIIRKAVRRLNRRDAEFVRLKYGLLDGHEHTLEEIGQLYGVTRERVRQRLVKACEKLQFLLQRLVKRSQSGNGQQVGRQHEKQDTA